MGPGQATAQIPGAGNSSNSRVGGWGVSNGIADERDGQLGATSEEILHARRCCMQGYLAHKEVPPSLGPP